MAVDLNKNIDISILLDKQKIVLPIIMLLIASFVSFNIYNRHRWQAESAKEQIREEEQINGLIKIAKIKYGKLSKYQELYGRKEHSSIMQEISRIAATSGVKIHSFTPGSAVISGALEILPFDLKAEGSYHDIGNFISKIESSQDIVNIVSISLAGSGLDRYGTEKLQPDISLQVIFLAE